MAIPTIVQSAYVDRRDAPPVPPPLGVNPTPGNLIVVVMASYVTGGEAATNGWTKGPTNTFNDDRLTVFYRYAVAGDTKAGYGAVSSASGYIGLVIFELSGVPSSWASALSQQAITFGAAATSYTPPALTTLAADQLALVVSMKFEVLGGGVTIAAPFTAGPGGSGFAIQMRGASRGFASSGSTVQPTITYSAAGRTVNAARLIFSATGSGPVPVVITAPTGSLRLTGKAPSTVITQSVAPLTGRMTFEGVRPSPSEVSRVVPATGSLVLDGVRPALASSLELSPASGVLRIDGLTPGVYVGATVVPPHGALKIAGIAPLLFTVSSVLSSQLASLALVAPVVPPARSSQVAALALAEPPPPPMHASQAALLAIGEVVPDVLASQTAVLLLGHGSSCVSERCQIWKITRRDGVVFRYTSHDRPVRYGGKVYKSCRSLDPSASENASKLGSVGNVELSGIIDDDGITEADLYGGLFDDAFVTVDLITWGKGSEVPRRLASGWTGSLNQGESGFKMEVLGPGARLEQQAMVQIVTPGCRWVFGSSQCGVNADSMKLAGTVTSARTRGAFVATLPSPPAGRQWENGRARWTSGANAGQVCETKTVDFATGQVVLWASPGFLPSVGDTFDLIPGCDFARDGGCTVYDNKINFGGFPDLPGTDALMETPDAQY